LANPSQDYPQPYLETCTQDNMTSGVPNTIGCQDAALTTYNQENASEGLPSVKLPANFDSLPRDEQIFILVNEARVDRGLAPVYGLASGLQGEAAQAAETDYDPDPENVLPPGANGSYSSIWSGSFGTISSMSLWMYDDGYSSNPQLATNEDCTFQGAPGCWGHRDAILGTYQSNQGYTVVGGAASVVTSINPAGFESDTMSFVPVLTSDLNQIQFVYTWAQAVADGA